jgi:serine/threonine protein kinase
MGATQKQLREGSIIGSRYQIEGFLRIGDLGDVYLSRDIGRGNTRVVIKILRAAASIPGFTDSLSCKLSLLQRLKHSNLARILDLGAIENSEDLFLVEEQIDGKELYSGTEGFDVEKILSLAMELSNALRFLHARSVIHGNL